MRRLGLASLLLCALGAVTAPSGAQAAASRGAPRVRLVPPLEGADVITAGVERDGTRRLISRGLRVALRSDGEIAVADELLPADRAVVAVELPARFGGGYLFASSASGRTTLWNARTWTGKLTGFADIDFDVGRIVPGFDRLHVQARRSGEWAALDPVEGTGMDRGGLPASPSYGAMAFADSWFGAVELPVRGTVVSFDAGASWHSLGFTTTSLGVEPSGGASVLALGTPEGTQLLSADGRLRAAPARATRAAKGASGASSESRVMREGSFGRLPLRTAVLRGVPQPDGVAAVVSRGALGRIRLSDGRVLSQRERAVSATMECTGARVASGYGFVCGEPRGKTEIFTLAPPLGLEPWARFDGPRAVFPSDNGGLVVSGSCRSGDTERAVCIVTPKGEQFELSVERYAGRARVAALSDGRAAVLVPPSTKARESRGSLELIDASGRSRSIALKPVLEGDAAATLLESGYWMQGLVEGPGPALYGWVVGRGAFLGVRIGLDGKLSAGPLARSIENAVFSGRSALVMGVSGLAEQSANGGFDWSDAGIANGVEGDSERSESQPRELEQGCSAVGCVFKRWLRVGWDSDASVRPLVAAPRPRPTVLPSPGGGRWHLECHATGKASRPALPLTPRRGYGAAVTAAGADVSSPWLPLLDVPPPRLERERVGLDLGTEAELVQLRAYVEGSSATFGKDATFTVRVADRFRVDDAVWSTSASPSPWSDSDQVMDAFGLEGGSPSGFRVAVDGSGAAAVLSINWRGTTDLYLLERDRPIRRIADAPRHGLGPVTSTVRVGSTFYVTTAIDTRSFRVFALEQGVLGEPRLVGEYRDVPAGSGHPVLVRMAGTETLETSARRGLGLWARGAGWYIFPIDERSGRSAPPIELTARTLASVPRTCAGDEEGFLLDGVLGLEPIVEWSGRSLESEAETSTKGKTARGSDRVSRSPGGGKKRTPVPVAARAIEGRFIASSEGLCVRELAAQADRPVREPFARGPIPAQSSLVPLVLSDRGEGGRRYEFRCTSAK